MEGVLAIFELALLAALPIAAVLTRLGRRDSRATKIQVFCAILALAAVGTGYAAEVSLRGVTADLWVLLAASIAYSTVFILAFRLEPGWLRFVVTAALGLPVAAGYFLGTAGILGLVFIAGEVSSSTTHSIADGLLCRTVPFGNATTSVNGLYTYLVTPLGPFERQVFYARYIDPITPEEACRLAAAKYAS